MTSIRLTKKLARIVNGIDITSINVGDIVELPNAAAAMMVREGWAEVVSERALRQSARPTNPSELIAH